MGISERKAREKEQLRLKILDAAEAVFNEEGFENATIRKIAERIEYSPGTVYLHFKQGKDELFYEIHGRQFDRLYKKMEHLWEVKNPLDRLQQLGRIYLRFAMDHPQEYDLMFVQNAPLNMLPPEDKWNDVMNLFGIFHTSVSECMEQGLIRFTNLYSAILSIWGMVHGMATLHARGRLRMMPEENIEELITQSSEDFISVIRVS